MFFWLLLWDDLSLFEVLERVVMLVVPLSIGMSFIQVIVLLSRIICVSASVEQIAIWLTDKIRRSDLALFMFFLSILLALIHALVTLFWTI